MDVKASARAKRASSQRGRARHSTRKHPVAALEQRAASNASQQPDPSKPPGLPSNWNRHEEEEEEEEVDEESIHDASLPTSKSKGANYKDLLSEMSMYQASDLARGRKGMMASHGLDLWARLSDVDNFWSTHTLPGDEQDSFFSLDLNLLSTELAKVDMAERLLVDPKYLAHEECKEVTSTSTSRTKDETDTLEISSPPVVAALTSANQVRSQQRNPVLAGIRGPVGTGEPPKSLNNCMSEAPHIKGLSQYQEEMGKVTMPELPKKANTFEARAAEAELDALLDMFDTHKIGEDMSTLSRCNDLEPAQSLLSTSGGPYVDNFTQSTFRDPGINFLSKVPARANVPDVRLGVNTPTNIAVTANANPTQTSSAGSLNPDDDLDDWLDSL